jgi:hypothetical protein
MPGQIGTSIRANTRKIHSGDRESDAIDTAGLAQARERFALLGRDVPQLSDDQLRNLVAELERRFREEALTSAAQAATIILDGVKADRWRILVRADALKIDEMVRQSPERAYGITFFNEFARAAGWTERLSLENPRIALAELIHQLVHVRGTRGHRDNGQAARLLRKRAYAHGYGAARYDPARRGKTLSGEFDA